MVAMCNLATIWYFTRRENLFLVGWLVLLGFFLVCVCMSMNSVIWDEGIACFKPVWLL